MTSEYSMVPVEGSAELVEAAGPPAAPPEPASPLTKIMAVMRGRWLWGVGVALLFAAGGGAAGFVLPQPRYQSMGVIAVEAYKPPLMHPNEMNEELRMLSAFIARQVARIKDRRVAQRAMNSAEWKANGDGRSLVRFLAGLSIDGDAKEGLIRVGYEDADPALTAVAVSAVIKAYIELYPGLGVDNYQERMNAIQQQRNRLDSELRGLRQRRITLAQSNDYGTDDLSQIYQSKLQRVTDLETQLSELQLALASMEAAQPQGNGDDAEGAGEQTDASPDGAPQEQPELTVETIAEADARMREHLQQRRQLERELEVMELNLGPNHRRVKESRTLLASINRDIEQRAAEYRESYDSGSQSALGVSGTAEQIRRRRDQVRQLYDLAKQEAFALAQERWELESLRMEEERTRQRLEEVQQRIESLNVERQFAGRVEVESYGAPPLEPILDRRKLMTAAGTVFGGSFGLGLVLLVGLLDRRVRSFYDAEESGHRITMLGVLPQLPEDLADPEQAEITAHSVHQIRTLLQIGAGSDGGRVFTITSADPLDGKTSLTMALGMSFAASGARTLLVDCDLVHGGLTERIGAIQRRKIGQVLQREQLVTEQQVEQALRIAQESNQRLGEALIELGYLAEEDLEDALRLQEDMTVGLLEALRGEPLEACTAETGVEGLWILPIGHHDVQDAFRLSPRAIQRVFEEVREQFDVVLVDTGPVPGSLEASHVAVASDGVVLVVARGGQRSQMQTSIDRLHALGAHIAGIVFNRAMGGDLRALSDSSYGRRSGVARTAPNGDADEQGAAAEDEEKARRYGPIARTIAGWSGSGRRGSGRRRS